MFIVRLRLTNACYWDGINIFKLGDASYIKGEKNVVAEVKLQHRATYEASQECNQNFIQGRPERCDVLAAKRQRGTTITLTRAKCARPLLDF